jgi:hypothetical protein
VAFVSAVFQLSERTACKLLHSTNADLSVGTPVLGVELSSYRYEPRPDRNIELRAAPHQSNSISAHVTDIIGSVHLNMEPIRVIELERFL